jgi:hypothetical protein
MFRRERRFRIRNLTIRNRPGVLVNMVDDSHPHLRQVIAVVAAFQMVLLGVTWKLWSAGSEFPRVPLFWGVAQIQPAIFLCLTVTLLICSLLTLTGGLHKLIALRLTTWLSLLSSPGQWRAVLAGSWICGVLLILLNQHCLQAWHWFYLLCLTHAVVLPSRLALTVIQRTVSSVYIFSAVSRMSPQIADSMTGQISRVLLEIAGLNMAADSPAFVSGAAWFFTLCELMTGIALLRSEWQRPGLIGSCVLHACLILALGPIGLHHHWGVLVWNSMFLLLVPLLFLSSRERAGVAEVSKMDALKARLLTSLMFLLPFLGLIGWFDNWPSWQLYSSRPEVLKMYVRGPSTGELPSAVQLNLGETLPFEEWRPVRIDRWSFQATQTPIYPEDRFQLAVIAGLAVNLSSEQGVRVVIDSPAGVLFWRRQQRTLNGRSEILAEVSRYWLNAQAVNGVEQSGL